MDYLVHGKRYGSEVLGLWEFVTPNTPAVIQIVDDILASSREDPIWALWDWSCRNIKYPPQPNNGQNFEITSRSRFRCGGLLSRACDSVTNSTDFWQLPFETLAKPRYGDCLPLDTEIYSKSGIVKVGDLKIGDMVLSYDFTKRKFCYKPIINIWKKGPLPIKSIRLRNGHNLRTTADHPFWCRLHQIGESEYSKKYLKDINLTKYWTRRIPCTIKLPYEVKDVSWLTEDLCFVVGHFVAEGWVEKGHCCTSGYECDQIVEILEKYEIPFSEGKNGGGVPIIRFLKSDFKEFLKTLIKSSFDIHLPEWFFHLPESKLQAFIDGHFLGDGNFIPEYKCTFGISNSSINWSTSSEEFAFALNRILLQLGKPVYFYKQEHHGGVGKHPIWRLRYKEGSAFCTDHGYSGLSEVSIAEIEDDGEEETIDFEVADTHSFVFKCGVIGHQCDDKSFALCSMLLRVMPRRTVCCALGTYQGGGHCWVDIKNPADGQWYVLEPTAKDASGRGLYDTPDAWPYESLIKFDDEWADDIRPGYEIFLG